MQKLEREKCLFRKSRVQVFFLLVVCCQVKRPRDPSTDEDGRNADAFSFFFVFVRVFVELRSSPTLQ